MVKKLKILVVTYLPWSNDLSVGNTLSNIFRGMEDKLEFANIYFREDVPNNDIVSRFFNISEKQLAKNIIKRKSTGKEIFPKITEKKEGFIDFSNFFIKLPLKNGIVRDIIGNWKDFYLHT